MRVKRLLFLRGTAHCSEGSEGVTGEKSTGPGKQKQFLGNQKRESFQTGWRSTSGVLVVFSTAGSERIYSVISQNALDLPYVPQLPQSPLSIPGHHCQPQLRFPSQEYSADAGLYLAATRYSLFSLRS